MTWAQTGSKQVAVVGMDEKQAFTLLVSVATDRTILPYQAIFQCKTKLSLLAMSLPNYDDAMKARFKFEFSGMKTYWSNQKAMHTFVNNILTPYFTRRKVELRLPIEQESLWQIDVWSIHHSKEFCNWMHIRHLNVIIDFVPEGCTGVHQPCDVGIQQPLKLLTRKSYHENIVNDFLKKLDKGNPTLSLNDSLGVICNQSV